MVAVSTTQAKVDMINARKSPIVDHEISQYLAEKELRLTATLDKEAAYSEADVVIVAAPTNYCLLYTSPSPRDSIPSRMPSSA